MMSKTKRWLDELPLESSERELLLVGKSARPAHGAIDANWQALSLALGATAAASGAGTSVIAAQSVSAKVGASISASAKVGTSIAAGKLAGAGLVVASAKSLAIGAVLGLAVMGAGALVEASSRNDEPPATVVKPTQVPIERRAPPSGAPPTRFAAEPSELAIAPTSSAPEAMPSSPPPPRERSGASSPALNQASASALASAPSPADKTASLSQQARELAELKRLIDSGATSEALRRLDTNFSAEAVSVLSEERDALYVQALDRAQRRDEARAFARRFLARYPRSPYSETMRRLLAAE